MNSSDVQSQQLILSVFHGVDLFGRGFEAEGFTVVRAGEIDLGFDVRKLRLPVGRFDGVIAGTPCQDFSLANRTNRTYEGYGKAMLQEFCRLVTESRPTWCLLENVPAVPDIFIEGYTMQRFDLNASDCGLEQNRLRHFQFGSIDGRTLEIDRSSVTDVLDRCVTVAEGQKDSGRRTFARFCELQGLPSAFDLPYFRLSQKYKVIGQAVPFPMARTIARAILDAYDVRTNLRSTRHRYCICNCGRRVTGRAISATAACRKRMQRRRGQKPPRGVTAFVPGAVTNTSRPIHRTSAVESQIVAADCHNKKHPDGHI